MNKYIKVVIVLVSATIMYGCASTGANLQRETARSISGNVSPEQVTISNINRGLTSVKWNASAPNGSYDCSADDMVRMVLCAKK